MFRSQSFLPTYIMVERFFLEHDSLYNNILYVFCSISQNENETSSTIIIMMYKSDRCVLYIIY